MGSCLDIDNGDCIEVRGCTAFSFTHNDQVYHARDNDLPPFFKDISKSVYYKPQNGNSFILNTSSFINGEEGINNFGLAAAMTFVLPKLNEIKPGINSVFLVRYILEKCETVDDIFTFSNPFLHLTGVPLRYTPSGEKYVQRFIGDGIAKTT
jgi:predicted choloylglycine hydrolase